MSQRAIIASPDGDVYQLREPEAVLTTEGDHRFLRVSKVRPCDADGVPKKFDYVMIEEPDYVVVLVMDDQDNVYLTRQIKQADLRLRLECVAGSIDPNETPEDAAARETVEESGRLVVDLAELGKWAPQTHRMRTMGSADDEGQPTVKTCHAFRATLVSTGEQRLDELEFIQNAEAMSLATAVRMVLDGEIDNGDTRQAILLAFLRTQFGLGPSDNSQLNSRSFGRIVIA